MTRTQIQKLIRTLAAAREASSPLSKEHLAAVYRDGFDAAQADSAWTYADAAGSDYDNASDEAWREFQRGFKAARKPTAAQIAHAQELYEFRQIDAAEYVRRVGAKNAINSSGNRVRVRVR